MISRFLLLLGVSGVGKSALIKNLFYLDDRFCYISPDTTRLLRYGEVDKRYVTDREMDEKNTCGEYLVINKLFNGIRYATPKRPITRALESNMFPVLDWPISQIYVMANNFPGYIYTVYVSPPSINELKHRLSNDGRDVNGDRLKSAIEELDFYWKKKFDNVIDLHVISESGKIDQVSQYIYEQFMKTI